MLPQPDPSLCLRALHPGGRFLGLALGAALLLAGCNATAPVTSPVGPGTPPAGSGAPPQTTSAANSPSLAASPLAADAGWIVLPQDLQNTPSVDDPTTTDVDLTLLLKWQGPGLTTPPQLGATVAGAQGDVASAEGTVYDDADQLIPPGYAVSAEVQGAWPTNLAQPVLRIFSIGDVAFHEGVVPLDRPLQPESLSLPPVAGSGVLEIPGQARLTPAGLAVAHSQDTQATVIAKHGSHVVDFGGDGDYWDVSAGVTIQNLGSGPLPLGGFAFQLFDGTWAESAPAIFEDPRLSADSVSAGQSIALVLSFETATEPTELRLLMAAVDANGMPTSSSLVGYEAPEITDGKKTFGDLADAVDRYQQACNAKAGGSALSFGESVIEAAGVGSADTGIVRTADTALNASGAEAGNAEATYVLTHGAGGWQVTYRAPDQTDQAPAC